MNPHVHTTARGLNRKEEAPQLCTSFAYYHYRPIATYSQLQVYHLPLSCKVQHNGFKVDSERLLSHCRPWQEVLQRNTKAQNNTQRGQLKKANKKKTQPKHPNQGNHIPDVTALGGKISHLTVKSFMEMKQNCKIQSRLRKPSQRGPNGK